MDNVVSFPSQAPILDADSLALQFLELVLPSEGVYFASIRSKRGVWRDIFQPTIELLWACLREADRDGGEAYFAVASFSSNASRKAENVHALQCFRLDVDYGEDHGKKGDYATVSEAWAALKDFCRKVNLPDPLVVKSGGGLHVYWPLSAPLSKDEWTRRAEGLKAACIRFGLKTDPAVTADAARVLRPPGTTNRKLGRPRPVELNPIFLEIEPYLLRQFDTLLQYEAPALAKRTRADKSVRPFVLPPRPAYLGAYAPGFAERFLGDLSPPSADAHLIADECAQIGLMRETLGDHLYEPLWYACLGVLAFCENGETVAHQWSKGDPRYDPNETRRKLGQCQKLTGATLCARFQELDKEARAARCEGCRHLGKITSPIRLGMGASLGASAGGGAGREAARTENDNSTARERNPLIWEKTERGAVKPKSYANTALAIDALRITGRHDVFHDRKIISGDLPENLGPELSDSIVRAVREMIVARFKFDPGKENVQDALDRLCEKNRFDPVCDYFDALKWDGKPRLDRWLIDYLGAEDTPLNRAFGRKTLVAAVRRAREPGCKFDTMLVLEGSQGTGKSTALRILAGDENFSDQPIKWDDQKQQQEAVRGVLIHEISELVGLRKAEVENIKSFLSRQSDRCRPAYGRYVEDRPRRCIFIGTTNNDDTLGYLADPSGARRFWPVKTGRIDLVALKRDRDQLWAEAAALEASGEAIELEPGLYEAAAFEQKKRFAHEPWVELVRNVAGERDERAPAVERISSRKLLEVHLRLEPNQIGRREFTRLVVTMGALGWIGPKDLRIESEGSGTVKGYERPVSSQTK